MYSEVTLWNGGQIIAKFSKCNHYSYWRQGTIVFTDVKGSNMWLRDGDGNLHEFECKGESWIYTHGALIKDN